MDPCYYNTAYNRFNTLRPVAVKLPPNVTLIALTSRTMLRLAISPSTVICKSEHYLGSILYLPICN